MNNIPELTMSLAELLIFGSYLVIIGIAGSLAIMWWIED